jgi:hypothetical protein
MTEITDLPTAVTTSTPNPKKLAKKSSPGIGGLINFALMVWMIWDLRRRSDAELNGKRKLWLLVAFVPPFGPIAYIIYLQRRKSQAAQIPAEIPLALTEQA